MKLKYSLQSTKVNEYFKICSLNTRRLPLHFEDIIADYDLMNANILCFQETKTSAPPPNPMFVEKYNHIQLLHSHGILICYTENLTIQNVFMYKINHIESIIYLLHFQKCAIAIANVYCTPNATTEEIIDFIINFKTCANKLSHLYCW